MALVDVGSRWVVVFEAKDEFVDVCCGCVKVTIEVGVNLGLGVLVYLTLVWGSTDGLEAHLVWHPSPKMSFS